MNNKIHCFDAANLRLDGRLVSNMFLHSQCGTMDHQSACSVAHNLSFLQNLQNLSFSLGSENHPLIQSFDRHTFSRKSSRMEEDDTSSSDLGSNQVEHTFELHQLYQHLNYTNYINRNSRQTQYLFLISETGLLGHRGFALLIFFAAQPSSICSS